MAEHRTEKHNGHRKVHTGAERVHSGFDRRKSWGDTVEKAYQRFDHRLSELVQQGTEKGKVLKEEAESLVERNPTQMVGFCFAAGLLLGLWIGRNQAALPGDD